MHYAFSGHLIHIPHLILTHCAQVCDWFIVVFEFAIVLDIEDLFLVTFIFDRVLITLNSSLGVFHCGFLIVMLNLFDFFLDGYLVLIRLNFDSEEAWLCLWVTSTHLIWAIICHMYFPLASETVDAI